MFAYALALAALILVPALRRALIWPPLYAMHLILRMTNLTNRALAHVVIYKDDTLTEGSPCGCPMHSSQTRVVKHSMRFDEYGHPLTKPCQKDRYHRALTSFDRVCGVDIEGEDFKHFLATAYDFWLSRSTQASFQRVSRGPGRKRMLMCNDSICECKCHPQCLARKGAELKVNTHAIVVRICDMTCYMVPSICSEYCCSDPSYLVLCVDNRRRFSAEMHVVPSILIDGIKELEREYDAGMPSTWPIHTSYELMPRQAEQVELSSLDIPMEAHVPNTLSYRLYRVGAKLRAIRLWWYHRMVGGIACSHLQ